MTDSGTVEKKEKKERADISSSRRSLEKEKKKEKKHGPVRSAPLYIWMHVSAKPSSASLHACGLLLFFPFFSLFFQSAEIRCGGCSSSYLPLCSRAARPQSIGQRAIISQREWLSLHIIL